MTEINKHLLNRLRRDILLGRKMDDLSISIESPATEIIEAQTVEAGKETEKPMVCYPADKMLCNLSAHSPRDLWTIRYKGAIVAQGEFSELGSVLTVLPKQTLSYRYLLTRQIIVWVGIIVILVLSFLAGITSGRDIPPLVLGKISNIDAGVINVKASLDELTKRQDLMQQLLIAAFTQLKSAKEVLLPAAPKEGVVMPKAVESVSVKIQKALAEQDVSQLLLLEQKKKELSLKDLELENKGFLPSHPEREAISKSIKTIEQQLGAVKEKYGLTDNP